MAIEILPLKAEHLQGAADLFAERFRHARTRENLLPIKYENPKAVIVLMNNLAGERPMIVALRDGRVVGILGGFAPSEFRGRRTVYSREWANGVAPGEGKEVLWRMYGEICGKWVAEGADFHVLTTAAADSGAMEALSWAGFFGLSVDAVRGFGPVTDKADGIEVRRAKPEDIDEIIRLEGLQIQHMHDAPVLFPFTKPDSRSRHEAALADHARPFWLACVSGRPVGYIGAGPIKQDASFMLQDAKTGAITGAYVEKEYRGKGLAAGLLQAAVDWTRDTGYERLAVDFEPENTVASRFWCRHFRIVGLSFGRILAV